MAGSTEGVWKIGIWILVAFVILTIPIPFLLDTCPTNYCESWQFGLVDYLLVFAIIFPAIIAFFGIYSIRSDMREAIAAAFVVCFFCVLGLVVPLQLGNSVSGQATIRQSAFANFMSLVGVVVVTYIGSEAAIKIGGKFADAKATKQPLEPSSAESTGVPGGLNRS